MPFHETYRRQAALLLRAIPLVAEEACFALKGGTAINLFIRDLPQLSVDIDLAYLPIEPRGPSLTAIHAALMRIAARITATVHGARITEGRLQPEDTVARLVVRANGVQIKIEVTPVLRGSVYEPEIRAVAPRVEEIFGFAEIAVVSIADLYAGKIVAALDRQHPRDFFDVADLLAHEGIEETLRRAFIVYLLSHNRPIAEVLAPIRKDISDEFARGFQGMTEEPVTLTALLEAREALIGSIVGNMPDTHRRFLVSFERGAPDWLLLGVPGAPELPAIRWRQRNLDKLSEAKRAKLVADIERVLTE